MYRKNEGRPTWTEGLRGGDGKGGGLTIQLDIDLLFGQLGESTLASRASRSLNDFCSAHSHDTVGNAAIKLSCVISNLEADDHMNLLGSGQANHDHVNEYIVSKKNLQTLAFFMAAVIPGHCPLCRGSGQKS